MNNNNSNPLLINNDISRDDLLTIIQSGLKYKEYKFVRQVVLNWLAAYPGDLYFNYIYAKTLVDEGKAAQALPILEMVEAADPEFAPVYETHYKALGATGVKDTHIVSAYSALTGKKLDNSILPAWSKLYLQSREAFNQEKLEDAELLIQQALISEPSKVLPAILHLKIVSLLHDSQTVENLTNLYHSRWIDCLYFSYSLASALMASGNDSEAVALLHQCVSRDCSGQVATRVWGENNPYKMLWPENLHSKFDFAIPQSIISELGWNLLEAQYQSTQRQDATDTLVTTGAGVTTASGETVALPAESAPVVVQEIVTPPVTLPEEPVQPFASPQPVSEADKIAGKEIFKDVKEELDRLASRLQVPGVGRVDRRFPVYVVFTTRKGLENQYGSQTCFILDELLKQVVESVRKKPSWTSILYYADDTACTTALGVKPVPFNDAWKLKLSIADLDKALSKRGEMIGSLLIVGGPEVVPFHLLPNPTDDADTQVASDNPYASTDDNYFIPEWPVGRLPGGTNRDAGILMQYLRKMIINHSQQVIPQPWWRRVNVFSPIWSSMQRIFPFAHGVLNTRQSFGYTAAVWNQASIEAFRPIGDSQSMLASPPLKTGSLIGSGLFPAKLGYFNLHGVPDSAEWFGQPEFNGLADNPEYPVALTPTDIVSDYPSPNIVFSEACYGAHIDRKNENEAISLKFLAEGTKAFVGSTCVSYGSVTAPLIAADQLAQAFWKNVKDGQTVGDSLRNAKIHIAQEISRKQGYLDGEDQKTLISFVLFGDPLAIFVNHKKATKGYIRVDIEETLVTSSETEGEELTANSLPFEVMTQVKSVVEQYLPGLKDAKYSIAKQYMSGRKMGNFATKSTFDTNDDHTVVTISKEYKVTSRLHLHYARLTFDGKGKVVKLAVSR
jgi:hypothetical protein